MKKILSFTLALAMMLSVSVTAFAAETNNGTQDTEITVNGTYTPGATTGEIISADIAWDAMDFTYTGASQGTWNPATHAYEGATEGSWSDNTPAITVKNHSNADISATLDFTADVDGVIGTFTEASGTENDNILELTTAVGTEVANAPTATASFGISGAAIDADKALGTITVTIAKVVEVTTFEALQEAVNNGGLVKLGGDIDIGSNMLEVNQVSPVILDLNGHTLSSSNDIGAIRVGLGNTAAFTVKNGTVSCSSGKAIVNIKNGTLSVENCTLTSTNNAALWNYGVAAVTDSELNGAGIFGAIYNQNDGAGTGKVTLSGTVNLANSTDTKLIENTLYSVTTILPGTYNFNPTSYVDAGAYTVTDNGDGTWTVTAK